MAGRWRGSTKQEADQAREAQVTRLQALRMLLWNQASADPIRAAEALIKIEAREVRLLGLDMPTKAAVTDPDGNGISRRERIKEAAAAAHTAKPGLLVFGSTHWSQTPWLQVS